MNYTTTELQLRMDEGCAYWGSRFENALSHWFTPMVDRLMFLLWWYNYCQPKQLLLAYTPKA